MRKSLRFHNASIVILLLMFSAVQVRAAVETFRARQEGDGLAPGAVLTVTDDKYDYMKSHPSWFSSEVFNQTRINNRVTFSINGYNSSVMTTPFTANITVEIIYYRWDATTSQFIAQTKLENLQVNYTLTGAYTDKNTYFLDEGGNNMTVTIKDFYTSPSNLDFVPALALEAEIEVERFYMFSFSTSIAEDALRFETSYVSTRNELLVSWDAVRGAEEYDLEWTSVNNLDMHGNEIALQDITMDPNVFRLNSTRITTSNTFYQIPLIVEPGYVVFRVRPVGRSKESNFANVLPGAWSRDPLLCSSVNLVSCMGKHVYKYEGLSKAFNWQSSVEFIEGGKNKVNISYLDATLRKRQSQTRLNTDNKILVGEDMYDRAGRDVITVLPVPYNKQNIFYTAGFNRNASGKAYSVSDFDPADATCIAPAAPMSSDPSVTSTGAAVYYSPQNPDAKKQQPDIQNSAYLPDAGGYPFVQKSLTLDNTGRVRAESGIGKNHIIGSGHESKFYYGVPFQEELDRLFGLDVGFVEHYKKTMQVDPNGQVSVTYSDQSDKSIAVALAGDAPSSLDPLDGVKERSLTVDLLSHSSATDTSPLDVTSSDGTSRIFSKGYLATNISGRDFHYDITAKKYEPQCEFPENAQKKCYTCVVDLSMSVKDECGVEIFPALDDQGTRIKTVGSVSPECIDPVGSYNNDFKGINMTLGSYQVSKIVSINLPALDSYTADFMDPIKNSCLKTFEQFFDEEILSIDTSGCGVTCEDCKNSVGVFPSWDLNNYNINHNPTCDPCLTEEQYNKLLSSCDALCKNNLGCEVGLQSMLSDVSPFGQYGGVLSAEPPPVAADANGTINQSVSDATFDPSKQPLSVFNETSSNALPAHNGPPTWKNPIHYSNAQLSHYYNENNQVDSVQIMVLSPLDGTNALRYVPEIDNPDEHKDLTVGTYFKVEPQHLKNVSDFIAQWKSSWAGSLILHHPEYFYYTICLANQASNDFDFSQWLTIDKVDEAQAAFGFGSDTLNLPQPLKDVSANSIDPYFNSDLSINARYKRWEYFLMKQYMEHYSYEKTVGEITIWEAAHIAVNCPNYKRSTTSCPNCLDNFDGINTDEEWIQFRSLYLSLKQNFQDYKTRMEAIKNYSYNGCIGEQHFDPSALNSFDPNDGSYLFGQYSFSSYYNPSQTCYVGRVSLLKDKVKRFPSGASMAKLADNSVTCYQEIPYQNENGVSVNIPTIDELAKCPEGAEQTIKEIETRVDQIIFETCGQCPLARDVQFLLDAIAREDKDDQGNITKKSQLALSLSDIDPSVDPSRPGFNLSCFPFVSKYKEFTPSLEDSLKLPGDGEIVWIQNSVTDTRLNASIKRKDKSEKCDVTIVLPSDSEYKLSDVRGVCCLHYTDMPSLLPLQPGHNFKLEGIIESNPTSTGTVEYKKIDLEGSISCIDISECPMPPICEVTPQAEAILSFFNALISTPGSNFITSGKPPLDVFSPNINENFPYDPLIRGVLNQPGLNGLNAEYWVWYSNASGNKFTGTLKDKNSVASILLVELFLPPDADYTFGDIIQMDNIRPDPDNGDAEHYFSVTALVVHSDGKKGAVKLKGYSPTYKIANCRPVSASGNGTLINN